MRQRPAWYMPCKGWSAMKNFHLKPKGDQWELAEEGGASLATYSTKDVALEGARRIVQREEGSLKIHKGDGSFEEERTFPRSADPVKSLG